jgi:PAS domain S-box-containing protein
MTTPLRVLMVEDSEDDALLVLRALGQEGFVLDWHRVDTRDDFLTALEQAPWDLVLSDYSMPHFDGLTAFELFKARHLDSPFLFVSGRIGEERAVDAMHRGVSDYVQKDSLARLAPAVRRELDDAAQRRQRKRIADALAASEERLRRLAQNAPDIIFEYALEPQPHFTYVSPAAERITGYPPQEHFSDPGLWLRIVQDEDRPKLESLLLPASGSQPGNQELRWQHRDSRQRWVDLRTTPILDESGRLVGVEGIVRDVTDRKALEAQLFSAQRMEAIGRLAGGIAHDFNNMLTVIGGYCSILRRKLPEGDARLRDVAKIENATDRSASLVSQLLAFSRRQPRNLKVLDFNKVLIEMAPMFDRLIGENVRVELHCGKDVEPVRADRSQMEQVLMNLVVNARDAMPEGGRITIETETLDIADMVSDKPFPLKPGRYLRVSVSDTGMGMDEAVRAHIFDPFFTTKEVGSGTGLGLSTVYGIIKQMDGYIWVYSEPGLGTTFKLYLPSAQGTPGQEAPRQAPSRLDGRETILLVEDEELVREAAQEILSAHGYTIIAASNGDDALQALASQEHQIDLLLTDLVMPRMNGVELSQRVRELKPGIKVLYTTGYSESNLPGQCSPNGFAAVLQKPFGSQALLQKVRDVLSENATTG